MKLSNTMIMNSSVMPSKKAFTLAEVLITLSILGVVAALTIPSLVNRQSEMAAIVKIKKAISQFEQVAEVYMAENEATSIKDMVKDANCTGLADYFKVVKTISANDSKCDFTTADGVEWVWNYNDGAPFVIVYDSDAASPKFGVAMNANGNVANPTTTDAALGTTAIAAGDIANNKADVYTAANFLKISKPADISGATKLAAKPVAP